MSNEESTYRVVFWGGVMPDHTQAQVARQFARRFHIRDRRLLKRLFCGRVVTLKRGLNYTQAQRYQDVLAGLGATCRLEAEANLLVNSAETRVTMVEALDEPVVARDLALEPQSEPAAEAPADDDQLFAARDVSPTEHPPHKYFDARAFSDAVKNYKPGPDFPRT